MRDRLGHDGDAISLCCGAADASIATLAIGSVGQLLDWLDRHGSTAEAVRPHAS